MIGSALCALDPPEDVISVLSIMSGPCSFVGDEALTIGSMNEKALMRERSETANVKPSPHWA